MSASAHTVIPCVPFFSYTLAKKILFNLLLLFEKGYAGEAKVKRQKRKSENQKSSNFLTKIISLRSAGTFGFGGSPFHKAKSQKVFSIYRTLLAQKGGKAKNEKD